MAESVAALGLAVNIFTILDFGKDFVKLAYGIYNSEQNAFDNFSSLRTISENLTIISDDIHRRTHAGMRFVQESDRGIFELAQQCNEVAQQMLDTVKELGLPDPSDNLWSKDTPGKLYMFGPHGHHKRRDAIMAAFKFTWNSNKINALQARLDRLMNQMTWSLSVSFRLYLTKSPETQDAILKQLVKLQNDNTDLKESVDRIKDRDEGLGSALIEFLKHGPNSSTFGTDLRRRLLDAVYDFPNPSDATDTVDFEIPLWRKEKLQERFISNLWYADMDEREFRIAEAHEKTFRWIFENPGSEEGQHRSWTNFRYWLESDEQLYWVTGKAGSGKSTLMKFVSQSTIPSTNKDLMGDKHRRCDPYLRRWAGRVPLVIATFYFWVGGSRIQTSKEGLYRTLLYQILQACPDAISRVAPRRWEALCLYNEDSKRLEESELEQTLNRAIAVVGESRKICLFIDGLDEFNGSYESLIGWVKTALKTPGVKACVASRPWTAFETALKGKPNLLLENLTYDDIKEYVTTRFEDDDDFTSLQEREPEFSRDLIEQVVRKASGVFLWVNLVCTSLLNGMNASDRVRDLQRRLDELPEDLEILYDRILDNIDRFYRRNAAEYFYMMLACPEPPEALLFYYAAEKDTDFAIRLEMRHLGEKQRRTQTEILRKRLNASCRGLIAIPKPVPTRGQSPVKTVQVQYMHRTVKDYMEQESVKEKLQGMIEGHFDPHIRLCAAALSIWKVDICHALASEPENLELHATGRHILFLCMHHASRVTENLPQLWRILDELETSIPRERFFTENDLFEAQDIALEAAGHVESGSSIAPVAYETASFGDTFLSLATKFDVLSYVQRKAPPKCIVFPLRDPFGPWSTMPLQLQRAGSAPWMNLLKKFSSRSTTSSPPTPDSTAANASGTEMAWPLLLDALFSKSSPNPTMVEMLLRNGADPNFILIRDGVQTTVWIEALAFAVTRSTQGVSAALDAWVDVLGLMVRHGANIETRTIHQALGSLYDVYGIHSSALRALVIRLRDSFRRQKFKSQEDAEGFPRIRNLIYSLRLDDDNMRKAELIGMT